MNEKNDTYAVRCYAMLISILVGNGNLMVLGRMREVIKMKVQKAHSRQDKAANTVLESKGRKSVVF